MAAQHLDHTLIWQDHAGGDMPSELGPSSLVCVQWRNGDMWTGYATDFQWHHQLEPQAHDIVGWMHAQRVPTPRQIYDATR